MHKSAARSLLGPGLPLRDSDTISYFVLVACPQVSNEAEEEKFSASQDLTHKDDLLMA